MVLKLKQNVSESTNNNKQQIIAISPIFHSSKFPLIISHLAEFGPHIHPEHQISIGHWILFHLPNKINQCHLVDFIWMLHRSNFHQGMNDGLDVFLLQWNNLRIFNHCCILWCLNRWISLIWIGLHMCTIRWWVFHDHCTCYLWKFLCIF